MGIFDRWFGSGDARKHSQGTGQAGGSADEQAIARYRYLIKTAPPEALEQAHAEAFARLTPEQRRTVLGQLTAEMPEAERVAAMRAGEDPQSLARVATRAELRQPGAMERAYGRMGARGGMGFGGLMAGSFLASMAGAVLGTAIAQNFLGDHAPMGAAGEVGTDSGTLAGDSTAYDSGQDAGRDYAGGDSGSGGFGGGDGGGFDV